MLKLKRGEYSPLFDYEIASSLPATLRSRLRLTLAMTEEKNSLAMTEEKIHSQ